MKKALVTGITGQDGAYLTQRLLELGYRVYGTYRRSSTVNFWRLAELGIEHHPELQLVEFDLSDASGVIRLLDKVQPDEVYNLAAQSFVGDSWQIPEETFLITAVGVLKCLEAIRKYQPSCRFYNAGSSEQFGDVQMEMQNETHPFRPRSPYGAAKCAAHHIVKVYRESYGLYAVQGLLFNHESERRGS